MTKAKKIQKRRRREGKTDYGKRLKLLKSGKPRIIFRKTNKYIIAQHVMSFEAKDNVKITVNSKELLKFGWPKEAEGSLKSISASYLTGLLIGGKIKDKDVPILDFGMIRVLHKSKVYGFIKGLIDSGVKIEVGKEDVFPSQDRIEGKHMKNKIPVNEIGKKIHGGSV